MRTLFPLGLALALPVVAAVLGLYGLTHRACDAPAAPPAQPLLASDGQPRSASILCYLEGPAVDRDGTVYFSDLSGNRIYRRAPDGTVSVFRADSGRANGNAFDAEGRLVTCEGAERGPGGGRRIVRTDLRTATMTVLTDRLAGKRYNSPNDLCIDAQGRIWFTDPYYGWGRDRGFLEMKEEAVYRIDLDGTVTRVLGQPEIQRPNGIAVSPDCRTLYLVDSHTGPGGNRKVWAFDLSPDGRPSNQRQVYDFGKGRGGDGMKLDSQGNLWVAAGIMTSRWPGETADVAPGVYVISPAGRLLGHIPIREDSVTNLAFGGADLRTLYVTAGKTLYEMRVRVPGYAPYPPRP
jgi:gluconolactonase